MRPFRPLPWLLFLLLSAAPAAAQRPQVFLLNGGPPGVATDASVVPEPEVILLLASGPLALGAVVYFRGMAT